VEENLMNAKIICFASAKGGTGKTVTAASIAKLLGALKKRVLLIDVDAATNGLTLFYLHNVVDIKRSRKEENLPALGIFECLQDQLPTPCKLDDYTDLVPAAYSPPRGIISEEVFKEVLSKTIKTYTGKQGSDKCDYIFLDAQAGSDTYAKIAIENADETVIVTEYDPVSMEGVERLKVLFSDIMPYEKTWILFNKILPQFANQLRDSLGVFRHLSPIHLDLKVMLAMANRRLAIDTEKGNVYTLAIMETASSLLGEEIQKAIDNWKQQKEEIIRTPVKAQMEEARKQIDAMEKSLSDLTYRSADLRRLPQSFATTALIFLLATIAFLVTIWIFLGIETNLLVTFVGATVSATSAGLLYGFSRLSRSSRKKEKDLSMEMKILDRRLDELMEKYAELRTLADSSLETVMRTREEQPTLGH
jgi:cellulose biosynthesis protein BcsQ